MQINLPPMGKSAVPLPHFPTMHQAFIFRAYEYFPPRKIADLLHTTEENVISAAEEMGLYDPCDNDNWIDKGYITIIRRMWHILPYSQLLEILEIDENELAIIMREEDFLDIKLAEKPVCLPVRWRLLTDDERERTKKIKAIVQSLNMQGVQPFDFEYDVQEVRFSGKQQFDLRMVYGFSGLYQHAFDVDSRTFLPEKMLEAYQKVGINAIWMQGVLFQLTEFPFCKEISSGYKDRISRLKDLSERCDKYGIKVYLYLNEPRSMPESFFKEYSGIRGHYFTDDKVCLCTSTKQVQKYISDSVEYICREVPKIGGFLTITRSENPTNCYSHSTKATCTCPRCSKRTESEVIAEVIQYIKAGVDRVNPDIQVIAWSWGWNQFNLDIIKKLPKGVTVLSQSELDVPFKIGEVRGNVLDYSMSIIDPGDRAKEEWKTAKELGLTVIRN